MAISKYERIKNDFLSGRIKGCRSFFEENGYFLEAGYCCLVLDKIDKAEELFKKVENENIRANWGLFLIQLIKGDIKGSPTYFEVRNFLEIDINIFITYCKGTLIEKIIRYADFMSYYNPECYKFLGRVFWANNMLSPAMFYLRRAKDTFYQDPELHYLLAYIAYHNYKDKNACKKSLDACLNLLPEYAPARKLLAKL
jgi:tetratricopeptide (TPR) repeat protein